MSATYRDRVADYLKGNPGQWVDGLVLQEIGGRYAWRSRVSDCRTDLGMVILNRQRKVGDVTISEYCYRPAFTNLIEIMEKRNPVQELEPNF